MQGNEQEAVPNRRRSTRPRMPNINGQDVLTVAEAAQRREQLANCKHSPTGRNTLRANLHDQGSPIVAGTDHASSDAPSTITSESELTPGDSANQSHGNLAECQTYQDMSSMSVASLFANLYPNRETWQSTGILDGSTIPPVHRQGMKSDRISRRPCW
jgi:hypothetical protein